MILSLFPRITKVWDVWLLHLIHQSLGLKFSGITFRYISTGELTALVFIPDYVRDYIVKNNSNNILQRTLNILLITQVNCMKENVIANAGQQAN